MWFRLIRLVQITILKWLHANEIANFVESVDEFRESTFFGAKERRIGFAVRLEVRVTVKRRSRTSGSRSNLILFRVHFQLLISAFDWWTSRVDGIKISKGVWQSRGFLVSQESETLSLFKARHLHVTTETKCHFFSSELSCTAAGAYFKLIMSVRDNFWNEVEFLKCQVTCWNLLLAI